MRTNIAKIVKIGIFTNNYLPNPYGVTRSIQSFRNQFEKLGHIVYIFAPVWKGYIDKEKNVFRYPSVDISFRFRFPLAIPYSRKMDDIIGKLDLDIIHAQHPNLLGTVARKWSEKKNIPLIFTWHTLYDRYTNFVPWLPKKIVSQWIITKSVRFANSSDTIIVPTESIKDILKSWGVKNDNIAVIPSGVEEDFFQNSDRNQVRKKFGISEDETLLFSNSRLTEEKNVEFLFRSVIKNLKNNPKIKFLIIGDGYLLPKLKNLVGTENLSDRIIFAGLVPYETIKNFYAAADIFVYASTSETQGMILTEAMYAGLPIVAVDATGSKDLMENNVSGFLVDEDEMQFSSFVSKLIKDKELRNKFSRRAAKIAREKYTGEICANKMIGVYQNTIKSRQKA